MTEEERQVKSLLKKAEKAASRLQTSLEQYGVLTRIVFTRAENGTFRFTAEDAVAPLGMMDHLGHEERTLVGSRLGPIPQVVAQLLTEVAPGFVPLRGKALVPYVGTELQRVFPTVKDVVGYVASLAAGLESYLGVVPAWATVLTGNLGGKRRGALGCDGAGFWICTEGEEHFLPRQIRAWNSQEGIMAKGELFPVKPDDLPGNLRKLYGAAPEGEKPKVILDRGQLKGHGTKLKGHWAKELASRQDVEGDIYALDVSLGVLRTHRPDTMALGPQITLRVPNAKETFVGIAERNFRETYKGFTLEGLVDPVEKGEEEETKTVVGEEKSLADDVLDRLGRSDKELRLLIEIAMGMGVDPMSLKAIRDQARARLGKKLYRSVVGLGLTAHSAALMIHNGVPAGYVIPPASKTRELGLKDGQEVVFGRYPIVSPQTGARVYKVLTPETAARHLDPWLQYQQGLIAAQEAIVGDLVGDDDGDVGFIITDQEYVAAAKANTAYYVHKGVEAVSVEGYRKDGRFSQEPAASVLASLARDLTGPVGVWTQIQDVLLFKLHGAPEEQRQKLTLAAMACAFMVQCSVDSKKNAIPLYPWWDLAKAENWTQGSNPSGRVVWSPRRDWLETAEVKRHDKVPGTKVDAMQDGGLNIQAAYAWLTSLVGEKKLHEQYLKTLGTDRRCVPDRFWGTEQDQLTKAGEALHRHPLHAVYNRVREMAFAHPEMKRFFSSKEEGASLAQAWEDMNLDESPAYVSSQSLEALRKAKRRLSKAISAKVAMERRLGEDLKAGRKTESAKAEVVREEDRIIGAKILVGELVAAFTLPQMTLLVREGELDWADFSYGENALTRSLGISTEECSWFSRNREEIMALKTGEERQLFLYGYTVEGDELAQLPPERVHPGEGAHACKACQDAFKASVLLNRSCSFSKGKVTDLVRAINARMSQDGVQEQLRLLLDAQEPEPF
jgi:hypothetical protein